MSFQVVEDYVRSVDASVLYRLQFHEELIGRHGILRQLPEFGEPALRRAVVQCLENICIRSII